MATRSRIRRIGFLGFPGLTALDLVGPMEVFATASEMRAPGTAAYALQVLALTEGLSLRTESGVTLLADARLADAPRLDTLIVPGGSGLRTPAVLQAAAQWLRGHQRGIRRVASVCTGVYALAEAGLLDGCTATTHWYHAPAVAQRYPQVRIDSDLIFLKQGRFYTSAGISAAIDLALALVEEDHGAALALDVARMLVVYLKLSGGQSQFSQRLKVQAHCGGPLDGLVAWMREHLADDLGVEALAQRVHLSARQLSRRFQAAFDMTPAAFVEQLRVEEASQLLVNEPLAVDQLALAVGFRSSDVFRRAFERRFGIAPSLYRERFGAAGPDRNHGSVWR